MEVALDKLRGARDKLPPEQHCGDMLNLLAALEGLETAQAELQAAKEEGVPATDPRLFQILVGLLHSLVLSASTARALFGSGQLSTLLKDGMLQPVMVPDRDSQGRTQYLVVCPPEGLAALRPDSAIKLLLAAVEVGRGTATSGPQPQPALKVLDMVFQALWLDGPNPVPPNVLASEAQRQLESQSWVPAWPVAEGQGCSPEQQQRLLLTPAARALAAELAAHAPAVTLADVRHWALLLRNVLCSVGSAAHPRQLQQMFLRDCQQLLSGCSHAVGQVSPSCAALRAFDVLVASDRWAGGDLARAVRVAAFLDASISRAVDASSWLTAVELIHRKFQHFTLPSLRPGSAANRRLRQQTRQEARTQLDQAQQCLKACKRWLPTRFQQGVQAAQQELERKFAALGGGGDAGHAPAPKPGMPRCSGCGTTNALHLRKCGQCKVAAYCSRACQVNHWKGGHKQECARTAADHAAEAASLV